MSATARSSMQVETTSTATATPSANLMRLAAVEVQSVMAFLSKIDLLHFSRCSRQLLVDVDTDHVWCYQPLYELIASTNHEVILMVKTLGRASTSSFIRHQPGFSLRIKFDSSVNSSQIVVKLMMTIPRIKRLTFMNGTFLLAEEWGAILQHSALDGLLECHLLMPISPQIKLSTFLNHIYHCHLLQTLTLPQKMMYDSAARERLSGVTCSRLTFYDDELDDGASESTMSTAIINCENLTKLHIKELLLRPEPFYRAFTTPHLCKLKELTIDDWRLWTNHYMMDHLNPVIMAFLRDTWTALFQLEMLSLHHIDGINFILPTLKSCTNNLKSFSLHFIDPNRQFYRPSTKLLRDLLIHHSNLSIEYVTHGLDDHSHELYQELAHARFKYAILNNQLARVKSSCTQPDNPNPKANVS